MLGSGPLWWRWQSSLGDGYGHSCHVPPYLWWDQPVAHTGWLWSLSPQLEATLVVCKQSRQRILRAFSPEPELCTISKAAYCTGTSLRASTSVSSPSLVGRTPRKWHAPKSKVKSAEFRYCSGRWIFWLLLTANICLQGRRLCSQS